MKKVTIQELAKELNLSRNTVAKALNNSDIVAYETRHMVISKAYELGYQKLSPEILNEFKITKKEEKIKTIAVVSRNDVSLFWNSIIMGLSKELNKKEYNLQLCFISKEEEGALFVPFGLNEKIDGMLILSVFSDAYVEKLKHINMPVVFLDMPPMGEHYMEYGDVVYCEGFYAVKKIVAHLAAQGIKKIGFIGDITYCKTIRDRYEGYLAGLEENGLKFNSSFVAVSHKESRYYVTKEVEDVIVSMAELPEAFVCANDDIAFDVIRILRKYDKRVPEDIAVTGYDNLEDMESEAFLTTVNIENQKLGKRVVNQLLQRIDNPDDPHEVILINTKVLFRKSSMRE